MRIIRNPADATTIADPELRQLIDITIAALSEDGPYDPDVLGYFLIVESGDSLASINGQLGFDILVNKWTGIRFNQSGYTQSFEVLDEHAGYYEMVFVLGQDGYGIEVFIPKGIDLQDLLAMCVQFAMPVDTAS
jgi:hypothetical protein